MANHNHLAPKLLQWYDKNARNLPWRIPPTKTRENEKSNPYHTWLSEIMLQQTTVATVKPYFKFFISKWPTIKDLASAEDQEVLEAWAGLGYYRRAHNLIKCARTIAWQYKGEFPAKEELLLKLPGVGEYSAAAIVSIGFNKKATVVDGNISRIISRLFTIDKPIIYARKLIKTYAKNLVPSRRFGDYTQALMDLGATVCKPRNPQCGSCPIKIYCQSFHHGLTRQIPRKTPKKIKPVRYGYAFVSKNENNIILELRPPRGLLGGMLCFPTSNWESSNEMKLCPPFETKWVTVNEVVSHTFTHFKLSLKIVCATVEFVPEGYIIKSLENFDRNSLPSLMRKVLDVGLKNIN